MRLRNRTALRAVAGPDASLVRSAARDAVRDARPHSFRVLRSRVWDAVPIDMYGPAAGSLARAEEAAEELLEAALHEMGRSS